MQLAHMTLNNVREAIESGRPFVIRMADGKSYSVPHGDFIAVSPKGTTVTLYDKDDHTHVLPLLTMTGISYGKPREARAK